MKKLLSFFLFSSIALAGPEVVPAPVKHLYLPDGFDSNDAVEVVVTGMFPNPCYSRNDVKVTLKDDLVDIRIDALNNERMLPTTRCPQMAVPFKEVVHLGNMQGGNYNVVVNGHTKNKIRDSFDIAEASSNSVDDHIYAAIEWVEKTGSNDVILHGWRYSNCIDLNNVQVVSNKKDTLSILPVMKQLSDFCPMKMMPTKYAVKLDFSSLKMKNPLLHVRTMDGKSVNTIINLEERR